MSETSVSGFAWGRVRDSNNDRTNCLLWWHAFLLSRSPHPVAMRSCNIAVIYFELRQRKARDVLYVCGCLCLCLFASVQVFVWQSMSVLHACVICYTLFVIRSTIHFSHVFLYSLAVQVSTFMLCIWLKHRFALDSTRCRSRSSSSSPTSAATASGANGSKNPQCPAAAATKTNKNI